MQLESLIDVQNDFANISLGDMRLNRRCQRIAEALQDNPTASFTAALGDDAATEGLYRFLGNSKVEWQRVLDEHRDASWDRAIAMEGHVLAIHDTSMCQFGGESIRQGAFRTSKGKSGYLAHTCLAVSADGSRQPLGVVGMLPVVRLSAEQSKDSPGLTYENERQRWPDLVGIVEDEKPTDVDITHVMDSEGDAYDLLEFMVSQKFDYVVRLCKERRLLTHHGEVGLLKSSLKDATTQLTRSVALSARKSKKAPSKTNRTAERDERSATLDIRTTTANILRPEGSKDYLSALHLRIVHVIEPNPPKDEVPVEWILATSHPIDTPEQAAAVVDAYRARWLIEEWFKSLKSGCAYQKRQLGSLDTLLTAFSLLAPIATRLLSIRWFARNEPDRPATDIITPAELECLRLIETRRKRPLPKQPTVRDVLFAVARMGGFLKQNKSPGWQTLGRGFEEFQTMFDMFQLMNGAK